MNLVPPSFPGNPADGTVSTLWTALSEASLVVATLAGIDGTPRLAMDDYAARIRNTGGWRQARAESALSDLTAIMEHGLAALLAVNMRGADPRPAARALLAEFDHACDALLALLPPSHGAASAA